MPPTQTIPPAPRTLLTDALFALQVILALISGGSQFLRLLTTSQGVSVSWLACWLAFLLLNLALTIRAHLKQPSRVTLQTVLTYSAWTTVIATDLGVLLVKWPHLWDAKDTDTTLVVGLGVLITLLWGRRRGLGLTDPMAHAALAACFIGLPQLTLAYKLFTEGAAGLAGLMLLAGHIGILTRLGQLWHAIREAGWDRNRQGAALSELSNEITWILVTLAWLVKGIKAW